MKLGRNAPCPCGSDKKYKKCCLARDEGAARETARIATVEVETVPPPAPPVESALPREMRSEAWQAEEAQWTAFWQRLKSAATEEKVLLVRECIETTTDFDGELAFDLINSVQEPLRRAGRLDDLDALMTLIAERHPMAFDKEKAWFLTWRVEDALLTPGRDLMTPLLRLSSAADALVDKFFVILDVLRYRNLGDALVAATEEARVPLEQSRDLMNWALAEFRDIAGVARLDRLLTEDPNLIGTDARAMAALAPFGPPDTEYLEDVIERFCGRRVGDFRVHDLVGASPGALEHRSMLGWEFRRALGQRGWSLLRADLATSELLPLVFRSPPKEEETRRRGRGAKDSSPFPLLPPQDRVRDGIRQVHSAFLLRPHRAAALALALIEWPGFLVDKGLVESGDARRFLAAYAKLREHVDEYLEDATFEPTLIDEVRTAFASAAVRQ